MTFAGKWITVPAFAALAPLSVFHRESEPSPAGEHPEELRNVHALFCRSFSLEKKPGRYLWRVSADDYAKLYVNGRYLSQGPTPGYPWAYHYNEFDVTDYLHEGTNVLTAHVYYQGQINRVWVSGDLRMGLIADLVSPDGSVLLSTDGTWEYAVLGNYTCTRTAGYRTQYLEDYDSRIPIPPFSPAAVRGDCGVVFDDAPCAALSVYERLPARTEALPGGGIFCDFGQEITASLKLSASGAPGARVRILCGEEMDDSPERVRFRMRCGCEYEETWTLAGGAPDTLEQYDYKAFRYAAILPEDADTVLGGISAVVRHAPFDDGACTLEADDKVLEAVFGICKNGVKYGTQEVYVDCPSREKGQYAGDMTVTSAAQLWLTGDPAMLEKGIREQARSAVIDEGLMAVMTASQMQEIADYSLQFPLLLLRHYRFTGDRAFLAEMLPVAERMRASFVRYVRADGLLDGVTGKWNLVDWPKNLRDGYDFPLTAPIGPGVHNVVNAFYVGCVRNIEEIRTILGLPTDGEGERLAAAFRRVFYDEEQGLFVDAEGSRHASLHANMLAPFYGFLPKEAERTVGDFLVRRGLVCGVYMAYFLLHGLCRLGRYEDVYRMLTSTGEISWYNMVREGGTTCFEAWGKDKKNNCSLCHPWASAPVSVLIEGLLSVSPDGTVGECHLPKEAGHLTMRIPTGAGPVTVRV